MDEFMSKVVDGIGDDSNKSFSEENNEVDISKITEDDQQFPMSKPKQDETNSSKSGRFNSPCPCEKIN